jgi:hypothetical protein
MSLLENVSTEKSSNNPVLAALADLKSSVSRLASRVDEHDQRFTSQESWNAEAQKRVNTLETVAGGRSQRQCPSCGEMRNDGPESFPGYLEPVARLDERERVSAHLGCQRDLLTLTNDRR